MGVELALGTQSKSWFTTKRKARFWNFFWVIDSSWFSPSNAKRKSISGVASVAESNWQEIGVETCLGKWPTTQTRGRLFKAEMGSSYINPLIPGDWFKSGRVSAVKRHGNWMSLGTQLKSSLTTKRVARLWNVSWEVDRSWTSPSNAKINFISGWTFAAKRHSLKIALEKATRVIKQHPLLQLWNYNVFHARKRVFHRLEYDWVVETRCLVGRIDFGRWGIPPGLHQWWDLSFDPLMKKMT